MAAHEVTRRSSVPAPADDDGQPGRAASFLLLMLQLVLVTVVVYLFDVAGRHYFFPVLCVIVGGFAIHAWLPMRYRLSFFALLSVGCVLFVLGAANGLWVLGIGGALIGICYLPVGFRARLLMLASAAAVLVFLRVEFPMPFWPILGSMFMFRLIIYVYDRRNTTGRPPLDESIAYFFLLPNVCFPLFPVVDYKTFRNSWYDEEEWEIYQRGVTWIVRGLIHLLLYRYVRSHLVPEPHELDDVPHVALFMVTNYSLYLQVSGQFHLITGLLHLFGFNLPRTHHLFFLASSFSDIWRRINIYWKDFMMKLFFFPTFHAARSRGGSVGPAIVLGVFCVFVCTWLLHSWQTFWLLGRFPVSANDACLWLGAGACVAANALFDSRRRERGERPAWPAALSLSLRTVAMFALVSLFWACWTKPGFLGSIKFAMSRPGAGRGLLVVLMWLAAAAVAGMIIARFRDRQTSGGRRRRALTFRETAQLHAAGLGLVCAFALPWFGRLLGPDAEGAIVAFRSDSAAHDEAQRLQGYYEDLNMAAIQASPLIISLTPGDESRRVQALGFAKISRTADAYQSVELIPNIRVDLGGSPFSVNQFGMRDRASLTLPKPPGTLRIALLGSSIVMGYGVSDDDVFGRLFENDLNEHHSDPPQRFEVLNFGVGKQWPSHRLVTFQRRVLPFDPDAVYYIAHQDEFTNLASHTAHLLFERRKLPSQHLQDVAESAGITSDMTRGSIQGRLQLREQDLLRAVYLSIVDDCRRQGAAAVYIYLPMPEATTEKPGPLFLSIAKEAGFITCDLSDWADGYTKEDLSSPDDEVHPDERGHRRIADALLQLVETRPETLPGKQ